MLPTHAQRPCIYCGSTIADKTSEHVLNKAFGTNLTLPNEVCDDCNRRYFSQFDTALVNYVRNLDSLRNHPAVGSHDLMFFNGKITLVYEPEDSYHFAVRLDTKGGAWNRIPLQQVAIRPGKKLVYIVGEEHGDYRARMGIMRSELALPEMLSFTFPDWRTLEDDRPGNPIIVRSSKDVYAVVSESKERDEEILSVIKNGGMEALFASLKGESTPRRVEATEFRVRGHFLDISIPIAKIAFNFACKVLGYEAVMRREFNWARRFIRYNERPEIGCVSVFTAKERAEKVAENSLVAGLCSCPGHKLLLTAYPGRPLQVNIFLYEQLFANVELLRSDETGWMDEAIHVAVFDYHQKTHEILSMPKDLARITKLVRSR